jgi:hypothetical protein
MVLGGEGYFQYIRVHEAPEKNTEYTMLIETARSALPRLLLCGSSAHKIPGSRGFFSM